MRKEISRLQDLLDVVEDDDERRRLAREINGKRLRLELMRSSGRKR